MIPAERDQQRTRHCDIQHVSLCQVERQHPPSFESPEMKTAAVLMKIFL